MKNETSTVPNQNSRIFNEAVADILNRIEQYSFHPKYLLTLEFSVSHKSPNDLNKDLHHIDRVIGSFIHRSKRHRDTPGRIYFVEPHADRGYHVHVVLEKLPLNTIQYYADKTFFNSPERRVVITEQEARVIEMLGAHLRRYVKKMSKSKRGFNSKIIYNIEGLTRYLNKSCYNPRVIGVDHIAYLNGSIFNPKWIENRINMLKGGM